MIKLEILGDSPEAVALALFVRIKETEEGKNTATQTKNKTFVIDREWILKTYAECLAVVRESPSIKTEG